MSLKYVYGHYLCSLALQSAEICYFSSLILRSVNTCCFIPTQGHGLNRVLVQGGKKEDLDTQLVCVFTATHMAVSLHCQSPYFNILLVVVDFRKKS